MAMREVLSRRLERLPLRVGAEPGEAVGGRVSPYRKPGEIERDQDQERPRYRLSLGLGPPPFPLVAVLIFSVFLLITIVVGDTR